MQTLDEDFLGTEIVFQKPPYATRLSRLWGFLIDWSLIGLAFYVGFNYEDALIFVPFVMVLFYQVFCEFLFGQTLGKKLMGIRVLDIDFKRIHLREALLRNFFHIAFVIAPILYMGVLHLIFEKDFSANYSDTFAFWWIILAILLLIADALVLWQDEQCQSLHDHFAKTVVVKLVRPTKAKVVDV